RRGPTADLAARRRRRRLVAAAAAVVGAVLIVAPTAWVAAQDDPPTSAVATDAPSTAESGGTDPGSHDRYASVPDAQTLAPEQMLRMRESADAGPFADPARLAACLAANDLPAHARVLGAGPVEVDGVPATLLLMPGPHPP